MGLVVVVESLAYGFLDVRIAGKRRSHFVAHEAGHGSLRTKYVGGGYGVEDTLCYLDAIGIIVKVEVGLCRIFHFVCGIKLNLWLVPGLFHCRAKCGR